MSFSVSYSSNVVCITHPPPPVRRQIPMRNLVEASLAFIFAVLKPLRMREVLPNITHASFLREPGGEPDPLRPARRSIYHDDIFRPLYRVLGLQARLRACAVVSVQSQHDDKLKPLHRETKNEIVAFFIGHGINIQHSYQNVTGQPDDIDLMHYKRLYHILTNIFSISRSEYLRLSTIF